MLLKAKTLVCLIHLGLSLTISLSNNTIVEMLRLLVEEFHVDVNSLTMDGNNCLHYAGAVMWLEGFDFLVNNHANLLVQNSKGVKSFTLAFS